MDTAEPAIRDDAEGNLYVVYVEHSSTRVADIFLQKYDKDLNVAGPRVRVSVDGTAKTWRGDPPTIAAGPDGTIYIGWTRALPAAKGNDLVISVSRDGGRTFAEPVKVNDDIKPASHGMHSIAADKDGRVFVAWLDERNVKTSEQSANVGDTQESIRRPAGFRFIRTHHNTNHAAEPQKPAEQETEAAEPNSEVFFSSSFDGGRTFSANEKVASDVCPCCKTSLLAAGDGRLYLSWRQVLPGDLRHIAVASTSDKGQTFSEPVIVSDDQWKLNACPVSGAALASGDGGKLIAAWYTAGDAGEPGLYMAESIDGGRTFEPRRPISEKAVAGSPVAFDNSQRFLFSASGDKVIAREPGGGSVIIEKATLPAAAMANGQIFTVFVRNEDGKHSVWLAAIPR
jgi:hypothetical protein